MDVRMLTPETVVLQWLEEAGWRQYDPDVMKKAHKKGVPNEHNIVDVSSDDGHGRITERLYGSDGMPLLGGMQGSNDRAPQQYAGELVAYPREDSASRREASRLGNKINMGGLNHLRDNYKSMIAIVRAIAQARIEQGVVRGHGVGTTHAALDVLSASVSLWSYMMYRKEGRIKADQLPPDVAMLHRTMAGVRMSLHRLYLHGDEHALDDIPGWSNYGFSADLWAQAVEESRILVGAGGSPPQMCPASTAMIRSVMRAVIEGPRDDEYVADLGELFDVDVSTLLEYGHAWGNLEQARARNMNFGLSVVQSVADQLAEEGLITIEQLADVKMRVMPTMRSVSARLADEIDEAFLSAVQILGYPQSKFPDVVKRLDLSL